MDKVRTTADSAPPERETPTAPQAPPALGNSRGAALAAVARHASRHAGNRATLAILREPPKTTADMHAQIYGDSSAAHSATPPAYEFSDDPLADGGFGPNDATIRVKPGPVRANLIKPKLEPPSGEWLEEALKKDALLKELPDWARTKAIDALKDADEMAAEKIIDALPWDDKTKAAATAAIQSILQLAKGRSFKLPEAPPNPRLPDWTKPIDVPKAPGEQIFMLPPIKF